MYTEEEILQLIGGDTAFQFDLICDNIISYKSIVPERDTYNYFIVEVFLEQSSTVFRVDNLEDIMSDFTLYRVLICNMDDSVEPIEIFYRKYGE